MLKPLKDKVNAAEHQIAALTAEVAKLDKSLSDPLLFTNDPAKGSAVSKKTYRGRTQTGSGGKGLAGGE